MLRFIEEIVLLLLGDEDGRFIQIPYLVNGLRRSRGNIDGPGHGEPY